MVTPEVLLFVLLCDEPDFAVYIQTLVLRVQKYKKLTIAPFL